jgi:hypothetical protein
LSVFVAESTTIVACSFSINTQKSLSLTVLRLHVNVLRIS